MGKPAVILGTIGMLLLAGPSAAAEKKSFWELWCAYGGGAHCQDGRPDLRPSPPGGAGSSQPQALDAARNQALPAVRQDIPTANFGRYHALLIGNNGYRSLKKLKTAANDARSLAKALEAEYGFSVATLVDVTRAEIIDALDGYRSKLTANDNLLVYYAGHGWLDAKTDRGYWLPVDATEETKANWLSTSDITDALRGIEAKRIIVIADSCYSGALTRSVERGLQVTPKGEDYFGNLVGKKSRTVLTSGGLEPVADGGGGEHSVFAKALLTVLRDNRSLMDGTDIFSRVREQVRINATQTPHYQWIANAGHEIGGEFVFIRK